MANKKPLITVESPGKINSWKTYSGCDVMATMGHFMDLLKNSMSIDLKTYKHEFEVTKKNVYDDLKRKAKGRVVYIAADDDREGEAIGYMTYLTVKDHASAVYKLVAKEITKEGIEEAMTNKTPYETVSLGPYNSFLGRRLSDRIIGYIMSPFFTKSLKDDVYNSYSAGRVQSVAVKIVYDREMEIRNFVSTPYYSLSAFINVDSSNIEITHENKKIENESDIQNLTKKLNSLPAIVENIESKLAKSNPLPPYTTSTFQQDCSSKLGIGAKKAMELAQKLYEGIDGLSVVGGLITYMRTDSVRTSDKFIDKIRDKITEKYGVDKVPANKVIHKTKVKKGEKEAQDAHEGIRPTNLDFNSNELSGDLKAVYELIEARSIASQMIPAIANVTTVTFKIGDELFGLKCQSIEEEGYILSYKRDLGKEVVVPKLNIGDEFFVNELKTNNHKTKPPGRYTEASLTKKLESEGIGRPSTYAPTMSLIVDRGYVEAIGTSKKAKNLTITKKGEIFVEFALKHDQTKWLLDYGFTRDLELELDKVEAGDMNYIEVLKSVHGKMGYHIPVDKAKSMKNTGRACPCCGDSIMTDGKVYKCNSYKYNSKTKSSDACQFLLWIDLTNSKRELVGKITEDKLDNLLAGGTIDKEGVNHQLNTHLIEHCKSGKKNKNKENFLVKKLNVTNLECKLCGGSIAYTDKQFHCENNKLGKKSGKFVNIGSCGFRVNKENDYTGYKLDEFMLGKLLNGEIIRLENGKEIVFDPTNQYFIKDKSVKTRVINDTGLECPKCGSAFLEDEKVFKCSAKKKKSCKLTIFKRNDYKNFSVDLEAIKVLFTGNEYELEDGRVLTFDIENKFPLQIK